MPYSIGYAASGRTYHGKVLRHPSLVAKGCGITSSGGHKTARQPTLLTHPRHLLRAVLACARGEHSPPLCPHGHLAT
jgi:hypothetical protein